MTPGGTVADDELERFCADAYPKLVGALTHHFGDRWLAEELAQEALVRVCDHWSRVRAMSSPVGWAFRVGANLGRSRMRRRAAERRARQRHGPGRTVHRDTDTADRLAVQHALAQLTTPQREAVVLRYFLQLTADEAAEVTGSSAGAVRGLTFRAMRVLRDALDVQGDDKETADAS